MSTCVRTPVAPVLPLRAVLMSPLVSAPAPPAAVLQPAPSVPHDAPAPPWLVSATRVTFSSEEGATVSQTTAAPAAPPLSQPFASTLEVYISAGMQKAGTVKPPAGTMPVCLHVASAAPTSSVVCTFGGKGKGAKPSTVSVPALLVVTIRAALQHASPGIVVVVVVGGAVVVVVVGGAVVVVGGAVVVVVGGAVVVVGGAVVVVGVAVVVVGVA